MSAVGTTVYCRSSDFPLMPTTSK